MLATDPLPSNISLPNPYADLNFPITGKTIPFHHGYHLYAAICHQFPVVHDLTTLSLHPICGKPEFPELLHLTEDSYLRLRLPTNQIPLVYRLAGKTLFLKHHKIRIGLPEEYLLKPCDHLYSRLVILSGLNNPEDFLRIARYQLDQRNIAGTLRLITRLEGEPIRRTLIVKEKTLVGFGVEIHDLNEEDSISIQKQGIGGKHKFGCGVFVPVQAK